MTQNLIGQVLKMAQDDLEAITGQPVLLTLVMLPMEDLPEGKRKELLLKKAVCDACAISWLELKSQSRKRDVTMARQLFCYFAKDTLNYSLKAIGDIVGGRDHSTVIHSIKTVEDLLAAGDAAMTFRFKAVQKKLNTEQ